MLNLEHIQRNAVISGMEPSQVARIVTTKPLLNDSYSALTVYFYYKLAEVGYL